ncbi:phage major capsid protein [Pantoea sp. JZ2]|uniref:phage major capsid protein n=1 Tax=Pantoea sp. JZ2 TaxID=2654189 RepID=UPI002B4A12D2|nr:phage major capsid protein [Pantoea sp. JZ2]WRH11573.1 phage major capsid protein [Pantoea sp. JZ2]
MKGLEFVKAARILARCNGRLSEAKSFSEKDQKLEQYFSKALVAGATTSDSPLITTDVIAREFAEYVFSQSIPGRLMARAMQYPFKTKVGAVSGIGAGWLKEGSAVPVRKGAVNNSETLKPFKMASLVVVTDELLRLSSPGADSTIRNMMVSESIRKIDSKFLSGDAEVPEVSPAGVLINAPSSSGYADLISTHVSNGNSLQGSALVVPNIYVLSLTENQLRQFDLLGISVLPSQYAAGVSLIDPANMLINVEGAGMITSTEGAVEMSDSPENNSSEPVQTEKVSLYQTNSAAIMTTIYCGWEKVGKPVTSLSSGS